MSSMHCVSGKKGRLLLFDKEPENCCEDGWGDLAQAIILQAVKDYRTALKGLRKRPDNRELLNRKRECERFFFSEWFAVLTEADPDRIVDGIRREIAV